MVQISIIVPVYQARLYIERLINSILDQDYTNYELILVDDGSLDGSGKICDQYKEKDSRIKVIHKKNEGVSFARNAGIDASEGKYIIFFDADDYIETNYLSIVKQDMDDHLEVEMIIYSYYTELDIDIQVQRLNCNSVLNRVDFLNNKLLLMGNGFNPVWNKVFCADVIKQNNIYFRNQKIAEDGVFVCQYLKCINYILIVDKPYYHYCLNEKSAVNKFCDSRWEDECKYLDSIKKLLTENVVLIRDEVLGIRYRNAVLYDLYNLVKSEYTYKECAKVLKEHMELFYDQIDWHTDVKGLSLKARLYLLKRKHISFLLWMIKTKSILSGKSTAIKYLKYKR